jgi:prepilin-type N-terminal cleavage/methylation domain-containing protein
MQRRVDQVRRAFTLIELLVVIAIIAILAAILFPVFARAREQARQATGLSNLKQQALAMLMYVQDYDEKFCPTLGWGSETLGLIQWQTAIEPYVKNGKAKTKTSDIGTDPYVDGSANDQSVFVSPAWQKSPQTVDASGAKLSDQCDAGDEPCLRTSAIVPRYSYSMNQNLSAIFYLQDDKTGGPAGWCNFGALACTAGSHNATLGEVAAPANTVLFAEALDSPFNGMGAWGWDVAWLKAQDRFNGNTLVALVDGHVKAVRGSTSMYTKDTSVQDPGCPAWWGGTVPELKGASIAACALNRPNANIYFGPLHGR